MSDHRQHLREAIELALQSARSGRGGPFGAVVVKDGKVIGRGQNRVTSQNDPTAHAEVQAIREACTALGGFSLRGCILYASCEPCPMCLGAIYWARLDALYFAASREDAAAAGFDDELLYREIPLPLAERHLPTQGLADDRARLPFDAWGALDDRVEY